MPVTVSSGNSGSSSLSETVKEYASESDDGAGEEDGTGEEDGGVLDGAGEDVEDEEGELDGDEGSVSVSEETCTATMRNA